MLVSTLCDSGKGGTFLDWTIHWLKGADTYYSAKNKSMIGIVNDPLTGINSHNHVPNSAFTLPELEDRIKNIPDNNIFYTWYYHQLHDTDAADRNIILNTQKGIDLLKKITDKTVMLFHNPEFALYDCKLQTRSEKLSSDGTVKLSDKDEILDDYIQWFFPKTNLNWEYQKNIWDKREFLALNVKPFDRYYMKNQNLDFDFFPLATVDMWTNFEKSVQHVFDYIECSIDKNRFDSWIEIYRRWQNVHKDRIHFCLYFDTIVESILNGYNLDLERFNLDLLQEAAILNKLLYKHNLNLKSWQLEKFTNTKQLHDLLEPNIHNLN